MGYNLRDPGAGSVTLSDAAVVIGATSLESSAKPRPISIIDVFAYVYARLGALGETGVADLDYGDIVVSDSGSTWTIDSGVLSAFGRTLIDDLTAGDARSTLGLVIGTDVQAQDAGLASIAGLTTAADRMIYTTAADSYAVTPLTAAARTLLDDTSTAAMRTTLGLVIGTNVQAYSARLAEIAALAVTDGNIIVGNGSSWVAESGATARASLGLAIGTDVQAYSATLAATTASFTTAQETKLGHISVTQAVDLDAIESRVNELDASVILKGAWDASSGSFPGGGAAQAGWMYLVSVGGTVDGVTFGVNDRIIALVDNASTTTYADIWLRQAYTAEVLSVAGRTGAVTLTSADLTDASANGRSILTAANYAAMRGLLDLEAGTDFLSPAAIAAAYQVQDAELTALAGLVSAADRLPYFTGSGTAALAVFTSFGRSLVNDADAAEARTTLGLGTMATETATNYLTTAAAAAAYQPLDADLTALAGLVSAANKMPYFTGSGTAALADLSAFGRTLIDDADAATALATLGIGSTSTPSFAHLRLSGAAGSLREIQFETSGVDRWQFGAGSSAEFGSNAGSDIFVNSFSDAGAYIETPFAITRSTGQVYAKSLRTAGAIELGNASDTTLSRVSAGVVAIEGNNILTANNAVLTGNLFLASGGVINWNSGAATLTHSSSRLTFGGSTTTTYDFSRTGGSVEFNIKRLDAHGASADIGFLDFEGLDSASNEQLYARISGFVEDHTSGSEDSQIRFGVATAGTFASAAYLTGSAFSPFTNDGLSLGLATRQWSDLFLASGGVINFANGDVTLTHSDNALAFAGASSGYSFDAKITAPASAAGGASLRLPHGSAPMTPADGDLWSTTNGLYGRINGATEYLITGRHYRTVTEFGAKGDGTTDDLAAINAAIAAVAATGNGGVVYFPPGVYRVTGTINIGNGTSTAKSTYTGISLMGCTALSGGQSEYPYDGLSDATTLLFDGTTGTDFISVNGPITVAVEGFALDCNAKTGVALNVKHAFASRFKSILIYDWKTTGVELSAYADAATWANPISIGCMDNTFDNVRVDIPLIAGGTKANTRGLVVGNASGYSTGILDCARNTFRDCYFSCGDDSTASCLVLRFCDINNFYNCFFLPEYGTLNAASVRILPDMSVSGTSNVFPSGNAFYNCSMPSHFVISSDWLPNPEMNSNLHFFPYQSENASHIPYFAHGGTHGFTNSGQWLLPQIGTRWGNLIEGWTRTALYRDMNTAAVQNTTTATAILTRSIPGRLLQSKLPTGYGTYAQDRQLRMRCTGRYLNDTGSSQTLTIYGYYGATQMFSVPIVITASANPRVITIDVGLTARSDNTAQQGVDADIKVSAAHATPDSGALIAAHYMVSKQTLTEDSTGPLTMYVGVQHSAASASLYYVHDTGVLEMI